MLVGACTPATDAGDVVVTLSPPTIASFAWACDVDAGRYALAVQATSWTGGGALWLTTDGAYHERHPVRAVSSEADGSGETLEAGLGIAADWRDASPGSSTAFLCSDVPAFRFVIDDLDGVPADCRAGGEASVWTDVPDVPACETPVGDTGG